MSLKRHLTAGLALAVALAALTGSALAAPPTTPPGQEKKAEAQASEPAAQAQPAAEKAAPGQEKKADATTAPAPAAKAAPQQKKTSSTQGSTTKTQGVNSTSSGVKPSNSTSKNTACWTGGSGSAVTCAPPAGDSSKRYGNGTTAAQIATGNGAPAGTEIRGPGNSQPHKVCGKNGNWVDVHAVKSYDGVCTESSSTGAPSTTKKEQRTTVACVGSQATTTRVAHETGNGKIVWIDPNTSSAHYTKHGDAVQVTMVLADGSTCTANVPTTAGSTTVSTSVVNEVRAAVEQALGTTVVSSTTRPAGSANASANASGKGSASGNGSGALGGVAGAEATQTGGAGGVAGAGGVLGAFGVLGEVAGGTLPFTGFPLWLAVVLALLLIVVGTTLWRRGRPATRDVV